jgi:hypothetical protein
MWVIGFRNIPHTGQDTIAAVESYHANMEAMLATDRRRLYGRRMDWLIYHLTGDVIQHYWYAVQCKLYGYIRNKNAERVVASAVLRARDIPDDFVKVYPGGQDIGQVISVSNYPRTYTVLAPGEEYAQCNCPWAERGNICKHTMKAYKVIHPNSSDTRIIQERGCLRGTCATDVTNISVDGFGGGPQQNSQACPEVPRTQSLHSADDRAMELLQLHNDIQSAMAGNTNLLDHAINHARVSKGTLQDILASRTEELEHPISQSVFRPNEGDDSLKRKKGFLERSRIR